MGRYTSDTGAGSQPRRQIIKLLASNPAVPVPEWARHGIVYITGTGPGAGGGNNPTAGQRGGGGGAGGYCIRLLMPVNGAATIDVAIGAASTGALGSSSANAASAGNTQITVGQAVVLLEGGLGGKTAAGGGDGGRAVVGDMAGVTTKQNTFAPFGSVSGNWQGLSGPPSPFASGATGADGINAANGFGVGALSIFGGGGAGVASVPAGTPGANATGYGSGGAGSNGAGKAGDGAPSIVWLEFEEIA